MTKPAFQPAEWGTLFPEVNSALEAKVAPVKISRRRRCDEMGVCQGNNCTNCPDLENSLFAMLSAANAPGQRGNVWFAEPDPTDTPPESTTAEPKREPLTRIELIALVLLVCMSVASSLSVVAGVWWLLSVDGAFA